MSGEKPERRQILDPAVADLLGGMERAKEERQLPKPKRDKRRKAREKARERRAAGTRMSIDIPVWLKERIKKVAAEQRIPESQLIALACALFLADVRAGRVNLSEYKRPSKSPKYDWVLEVEES